MEQKTNNNITPSQYFDHIKGAKNEITTEALKKSYPVILGLAEKYNRLGQEESIKRLCFLTEVLKKEEVLIERGITTFIYKEVVEEYIEHVANQTVKIIELERYMREIPDELVEVIEKSRDLFNQFYVVFTDYTGKEERKVAKERRDKDPILFGVFKNSDNIGDRFYFLGDWIDEYCDLTLDKMVDEYTKEKGYSPAISIKIPETSEELLGILKSYVKNEKTQDGRAMSIDGGLISYSMDTKVANSPVKESFFKKVRSFFKI